MKMTLARALKEKKRLAGRIAEYENVIKENNVFFKENKEFPMIAVSKVDISQDYEKYIQSGNKMVALKNVIAKANAESGISFLVYQMEEKKSLLSFLNRLNVNVQPSKEYIGDKAFLFERDAQISSEFVRAKKKELQAEIERLQDKVDEFNATVIVDFDLELN